MSTSCKERYHLYKWVCNGLKLEIIPAVAWRGASSAGKPQPLVYHIPQEFFNALQQRLSLGSKKKRLPNFTTGRRNSLTSQSHPTLRELKADFSVLFLPWPVFVRTDGLPLGSFTKYTWHITDLAQVKRIFDTPEVNAHVTSVQPMSCSSASPHIHYPPQVPLELSQSFVKNIDGTYSRFRCPEPPPQPEGHRTDRPLPIRPLELRTFLRVGEWVYSQLFTAPLTILWPLAGTGSAHLKEANPFVIEWIPDVLPRCHMGELRIGFEYGHQQSGQLEFCEKGSRSKTDPDMSKPGKTVWVLQVFIDPNVRFFIHAWRG